MEQPTIIEVNGHKFEVDLRTAKKIETYRVGDQVKVLIKRYSDTYAVRIGFICGIDCFKSLPTISVCYVNEEYNNEGKLEFAYINSTTKDVDIIHMTETDVVATKDSALAIFNQALHKKRMEVKELEAKRDFFTRRFGTSFSAATQFSQEPIPDEPSNG